MRVKSFCSKQVERVRNFENGNDKPLENKIKHSLSKAFYSMAEFLETAKPIHHYTIVIH